MPSTSPSKQALETVLAGNWLAAHALKKSAHRLKAKWQKKRKKPVRA